MVKRLEISSLPIRGRRGARSYIAHSPEICRVLADLYGRENLCLKIFAPKGGSIQGPDLRWFVWGPCPACHLVECVRVQNVFAQKQLAPRVYDIVQVGETLALVTDFVTGAPGAVPARVRQCKRLVADLHLHSGTDRPLQHDPNWIGGKFVDFGNFCPKDTSYSKALRQRAVESNLPRQVYQPVESLGIHDARREMRGRLRAMRLPRQPFRGKDVLVLGCSLGWFCRYAARRGARRVVGIDSKHAQLATEITNWAGHWNVDFMEMTLGQGRPNLPKCDILLALAVVKWMGGYTSWLAGTLRPGGVAYFESHDAKAQEFPLDEMREDFSTVKFLGTTRDLGNRRLYKCTK